ncbi:nonstructural protein [Peromfec virus RodF5_17]|uniref:Nonstructural protein n=1 Tax=Peromfec virus RodF5_17 TaxID=2929338 RepID=A0A976N2Y2_9VIRU|nr:nonstructural protein [Peromfec virus RodF5_17]
MTNYLYSRQDCTTGEFCSPVVAANDDNACRNFLYLFGQIDVVTRQTFRFYRIGMWNNETGSVDGDQIADITDMVIDMNDKIFGGEKYGSSISISNT